MVSISCALRSFCGLVLSMKVFVTLIVALYCSVNHVRVVGRRLHPAFQTDIKEASGEMWLRYYPEFLCTIMQRTFRDDLEVDMFGKMLPHQQGDRFRYAKRLLGQYDPHTRRFR